MALTEAKIKDLTEKKFDELFTNHRAVWCALATSARTFALTHITGGRQPRPDDVAGVLHPVLEAHDTLRNHQEDNKARSSRFVLMFTEYVVDQCLYPGGANAQANNPRRNDA
jgi:hypothetical protein